MRKKAFTLIELMIVVAIIAMIAAILIPNVLKAREAARQRQRGAVSRAPEAAKPQPPPPPGRPPDIERLQARMTLTTSSTRVGMEVTNRSLLRYRGQLQLSRPDRGGEAPLELQLPFPEQTEEAMNVHLRLSQSQSGRSWEPDDWTVTRWGIVAPLDLKGGEKIQAEVEFEALGRDQLVLALPPAHRLGQVQIELSAGQPGAELAPASLQPQQRSPLHWEWKFQNLVSSSPLIVEMPASHSLTAKVLLLCRLAGLAVLLFGLGFWYVGELYRPGCLSQFGWGHFFMLAVTYSSFFPALSVLSLGQGLALPTALAIAAALAQPLLLLHVWRSVDLRFSLFYVLPLADLTLALVVNGVFGDSWREPIFLGAGFLCVAFVTVTYPRWQNHRQRWQESQCRELQLRIRSLQDSAIHLRDLVDQAQGQSPLKPNLDMAQRHLSEVDALGIYLDNPESDQVAGIRSRLQRLEKSQPFVSRTLSQALQQLTTCPQVASRAGQGIEHCMACGQPGSNNTCYCGHCGVKKAQSLSCLCGTKVWVAAEPSEKSHCPACGREHQSPGPQP